MVDATRFLLRWLYLSSMVRDVAEIQTLPYQPIQTQYTAIAGHYDMAASQDFHSHTPVQQQQQQQQQHAMMEPHTRDPEDEWKDRCLRGVLSFPPGTQRLFALDTLRLELVQQLAHHLRAADSTVKQYSAHCHRIENTLDITQSNDDPFLDADLEIVRAFEQATSENEDIHEALNEESVKEAVLVISEEGANILDSSSPEDTSHTTENDQAVPSEAELSTAFASLATFRDYLPQLMSAVLMSPKALQPALLNPVLKLRNVLLTRCLQDANWGIELCWLLEAEVGRAWKTLFEHRQQTGRRLIVVLPAEKAAVLAQIGTAKRAAFELLQEAEQATAYGYTFQSYDGVSSTIDPDLEPCPSRLPSSLSLRRCSHYGDTMHFIDRLTQISLNLRLLHPAERHVSFESHVLSNLPWKLLTQAHHPSNI
jgi:hypothetical protein